MYICNLDILERILLPLVDSVQFLGDGFYWVLLSSLMTAGRDDLGEQLLLALRVQQSWAEGTGSPH